MNITSPIGFLLGLGIIYLSIHEGVENSSIFLNRHAAIIVIGGTFAVALIMLPLTHLVNLFKVYMRVITGKTRQEIFTTIEEVVKVSKATEEGQPLEAQIQGIKNPFLRESLELVSQGGLSDRELEDVLEKRVQIQNEDYKRDGATYKILGKFPPAFGLIGATLGMISLLQGLGKPDSFKNLGPAMSVALVATFYGLVLANIIIIPVGENIVRASQTDLIVRRVIVDGVKLIKEKKHPLLVAEYLKSYLKPVERNRTKKAA